MIYRANWWTQGDNPATRSGPVGTGQPWTSTAARRRPPRRRRPRRRPRRHRRPRPVPRPRRPRRPARRPRPASIS
nr:carbohydrate-binding protein [uncultured Roseateles sp.]